MIELDKVVRDHGPEKPAAPAVLGERDDLTDRFTGEVLEEHPQERVENRWKAENEQNDECPAGDGAVSFAEHGIYDMSAIKLSDRNEVHGGHKQAKPSDAEERIVVDLSHGRNKLRGWVGQEISEHGEQQGVAEFQWKALHRGIRVQREVEIGMHGENELRAREIGEAVDEEYETGYEAGQRAGDADVEHDAPRGYDRFCTDDGSQRSEIDKKRNGWKGNEVRKRRVHSVITGREIVSELMAGEDEKNGEGVRESILEIRQLKRIPV